ncbi:fluoride efflux transporter FluC [Macrococcus carouselicus]|uniref:Fluoride-specific ion channel FluC n=1 Tax=Macrococcus carouselicus TaxID=69969 RepID=A0A9Q8CNU5_9STAP|nr:CrcB family protein [Macrococcus carouselicus]TDM04621.1 CrcB family protein [Macrococcus carouselicus]
MKYLSVCLFAFIGGILRYSVSLMTGDLSFIGTFAVNLIGAFVLGFLSTVSFKNADLKAGLTSGLVGSFTTFSTFSMDSIHLLETSPVVGVSYIAGTMIVGLMLSYMGIQAGERLC